MLALPRNVVGELINGQLCAQAIDRTDDLPIHARQRVAYVRRLDSRIQTFEVFALGNARYWLIGTWRGDATAPVPPFDALKLEVGVLWTR